MQQIPKTLNIYQCWCLITVPDLYKSNIVKLHLYILVTYDLLLVDGWSKMVCWALSANVNWLWYSAVLEQLPFLMVTDWYTEVVLCSTLLGLTRWWFIRHHNTVSIRSGVSSSLYVRVRWCMHHGCVRQYLLPCLCTLFLRKKNVVSKFSR